MILINAKNDFLGRGARVPFVGPLNGLDPWRERAED